MQIPATNPISACLLHTFITVDVVVLIQIGSELCRVVDGKAICIDRFKTLQECRRNEIFQREHDGAEWLFLEKCPDG